MSFKSSEGLFIALYFISPVLCTVNFWPVTYKIDAKLRNLGTLSACVYKTNQFIK